jgi:predicted aspartyl protease
MLIDPGNASSTVRPEIARRLNLKAAYAVDQASVGGVRRVAVAILDEVRAGSVSDRSVEAMIGDVFQADVDGVLGQSWLVRHDYLLDYNTVESRSMSRLTAPVCGFLFDPRTAVL